LRRRKCREIKPDLASQLAAAAALVALLCRTFFPFLTRPTALGIRKPCGGTPHDLARSVLMVRWPIVAG